MPCCAISGNGVRLRFPELKSSIRVHDGEPIVKAASTSVALLVLVDPVIHARLAGTAGFTEADRGSRHVLYFDGDVFHDVSHPGSIVFGQAQAAIRRE